MPTFSLFRLTAEEYALEDFEEDGDIWTETDNSKTTASRYTSEASPRDSVMKFVGDSWTLGDDITLGDRYYLEDSDDGKGEGVYRDYAVTAGTLLVFLMYYKVQYSGTFTITLYDQTNSNTIVTIDKTETAWTIYETNVTVPLGCTTVRVKLLQGASNRRSGPFLIDDLRFNSSAIDKDPNTYERIPERIGSDHQTLAGRRIFDYRAIHYRLILGWGHFDSAQYDKLKVMYYAADTLYFNDDDVPQLVTVDTVYDSATENFIDITNPSSTQIGYTDSSASLPSAYDDFDTTEFSTADYQAVDGDDSNNKETTNPTAGFYLYHRYEFDLGIVTANVKRFRVNVACLSNDSSPQNLDGCILYGWNGNNWVELNRSTNSSKQYLTFDTVDEDTAQTFIDGSDYVYLLLRSRNTRQGSNALALRTYFAECEINEGLDLVVELSHRAILDSNDDVVTVRNLTQGTTLVLDTDYTIAADRRSLTISNQTQDDEIEVTYDRYFEVTFASMPEEWLSGDPDSGDRIRSATIELHTLSESK